MCIASLSVLQNLEQMYAKQPLVQEVLYKIHAMRSASDEVVLTWIPLLLLSRSCLAELVGVKKCFNVA